MDVAGEAAEWGQCTSQPDVPNFVHGLRPGDPRDAEGKELGGGDQLSILYFDVFTRILYEATVLGTGTPKPIVDAELVPPEGPKRRRFCPRCADDLVDVDLDLRGRNVRQFPRSIKKRWDGFNVPDRIIAHVTRECGGNGHDHHLDVMSGSFEKETSGPVRTRGHVITIPVGLQRMQLIWRPIQIFLSACRPAEKDIPHSRDNWVEFVHRLWKRRLARNRHIRRWPGWLSSENNGEPYFGFNNNFRRQYNFRPNDRFR
jgi:hypothetical protein